MSSRGFSHIPAGEGDGCSSPNSCQGLLTCIDLVCVMFISYPVLKNLLQHSPFNVAELYNKYIIFYVRTIPSF